MYENIRKIQIKPARQSACIMSDTKMAEFLKEHPKMMGVLFTLTVLLTKMGSAAAAGGSSVSGP